MRSGGEGGRGGGGGGRGRGGGPARRAAGGGGGGVCEAEARGGEAGGGRQGLGRLAPASVRLGAGCWVIGRANDLGKPIAATRGPSRFALPRTQHPAPSLPDAAARQAPCIRPDRES